MEFSQYLARGVTLDRLNAFLSVVRHGTVIGAADGNRTKRSLLSRQIGDLEKALGANLFDRKGKRLLLTPNGKNLAILLASFEKEFEELFAAHSSGEKLTLVSGSSIYETLVFPCLSEILAVTGAEKVAFKSVSSAGVLEAISMGEADLGVVRSSAVTGQQIAFPSGRIEFAISVRRVVARDVTDWSLSKIVSGVPLATLGGGGSFVSSFLSLCSELAVAPNIALEAESFGNVKNLLLAGAMAAILPRRLARELPQEDFAYLEFDELELLRRKLSVVIDRRTAKIRDRLTGQAKGMAEVLLREGGIEDDSFPQRIK